MKPPGLAFELQGGVPHMFVRRSTYTEDKVWDAVEVAIDEGWSPKRFMAEARSAWAAALKQRADMADKEFDE